ncbi:VWA domain-containing protein, partial [Kiloniella sp.]|uniref:VWA domain-containing protein n=1 Tax=Kiloniella sp. TaxID=1938587 RepID=UPI003A8FCB7A
NTLEITAFDAATGKVSYTYTLVDNETHATGAGENSLFEDFAVVLTDTDGDDATSTLSIQIVDDVPTAVDDADCVEVVVGDQPPQNIAFVVDESGSVSQSNYETQIDGVRTFMNSLVSQGDPAELAISLVTFGSDAEDYGTFVYQDDGNGVLDLDDFVRLNDNGTLSSTTLDDTLIAVRADYDSGGSTNYDAAMQSLFSSNSEYLTNPVSGLPDAENRMYFISDGGPNASSTGNSSEIDTDIATAITDNNIQVTGIGVGSSSSVENGLEDYFLAVDGSDASNPSIPASQYSYVSVPNFADLADALDGTTDNAPVATGNVVTGTDVAGGDVNTTDGVADTMGADGFGSIAWDGATSGGTTVVGTYGTLTVDANGNYSYALDYSNSAVTDLPLGDTLPEVFTYTVTDGDGDTDEATLTLTIKGADHGVKITDLTPALSGGDAIVDEDDLPDGSDDTPESTTVTGDFAISAIDGLGCIIIQGQPATPYEFTEADLLNSGTVNLEVITELGNILTITGYDPATGVVSYSYELLDDETHAPGSDALFDDIALTVKDTDGDSASDTLSIQIVDDVPTAADDNGSITEGATLTVTTANGVLSNDEFGADGAASPAITGVRTGDDTGAEPTGLVGTQIVGSYGTLTLNADGSYTYVANGNLDNASPLTDTFSYTITDGDGDTDVAELVITINDGGIPTVTDPSSGPLALSVSEVNLPSDVDDGTITFQAGSDDIVTVEFDGTNDPSIAGIDEGFTWSLSGDGLTWTGSDSEGAAIVLTVSGGTATAGSTGTATVTVTLSDELKHDLGGGSIDISGVNVVATDTDGDTASAPVTVAVIDDVPTAVDDVDCIEVSIDAVPPQNIGIVMDFSGSVNSTERAAQVDSVKAFAATLFNGNPNVTISIVAFDDDAGTVGVFTDLATLNAAMDAAADGTFTQPDGNSYSGGSVTDFEAGLEELFSNSGGAGYAEQPGANNQIFFLSDGNRNDGASSISSNDVDLDNNGKALLNSGAIELTAVAIGDSVSPQTFEDFFGVGIVDAPSEVVTTAFADLADALNGNVGSSGNVATGNVVTGVDVANGDANTTDGNADDLGADGFGSITWDNVTGGTTVIGTYGTLTVDANGNYSYALDYTDPDVIALAGGATLTETFTYTVKDSDGDGDTATLTLTLKNTDQDVGISNLTAAADGGDVVADEDNLADGSSPDAGALVQNGDFNISTPDGVGDLTIGGEAVISAGVFTPVTITTPEGNALEITSYDPADGKVSYTYTLVDNSTGHGPADNGENNLFDNLNVTVTDVDGDMASSTLSIKIIDDVPTAENDAVETTTDSSVLPQNIAFVVDESGSVGQSNYQTQIDGVRTFITDLVTNGAPEKLAFSLVTFGSDAEDYGSFVFKDNGVGGIDLDDFVRINNDGTLSSTTLDDTLTTVRGNYDNGGSTNYDAGMQSLFASNSEYLTNPITDLPLSQNHLYFISDGEPNTTNTSNDNEIDQDIATSIINNDVQVTGIGIGTSNDVEDGLQDYFLNEGDGDSSNPSIPADQYDFVSVPNFANLAAQLLAASGTTQQIASGSLIANDDLGADGASVTAISIDGVSATFNGSTNSWELDGATFEFGYNTATDEFILIFDEGEATDLAVNYTITDGDGDTSSAVLNITAAEPLSAVDDSVITNITSGDIDIPDWVLTQNDGGSSARDISGVSNATGGSTSHDGSADETTFTLPDNSFGSGYTVVDEAANDDYDTPLNDTRATAVDLTDRSQWGPVTDGYAGHVKNAALPSILFKGDIDNRNTGNNRDYDMVAVSLLAGEKLILDIDNGIGGSSSQSVDARVRLYDSSGVELAENDDAAITNGGGGSTDDRDSYLEYTATSDGTYYVRVESWDRNDDGDYDLWLSVDNSGVSTPTPGFDYTVEDGADSDDASVVISTVDSLTLTGTDDGEILIGGSLADIINAGGGDDILIGGTGANVLTGGTGSDTFVLSDISSQDVITDFNGTADDGDGDILNLHDLLIEAGLDQAALDGLNDGNINDHVHLDSTAGVTTVSVSSDGNSFTTVATLSGVGDNEIIKVQVDDDHILNMTTL